MVCSGQVTPASRPRAPVRATWRPGAEISCCEPTQRRDSSEPLKLSPFPSCWLGSASYVLWPGTLNMSGSSLSFYLRPIPCRSSFRWETGGERASSRSLPRLGALGFLSGDLIQLVIEILHTGLPGPQSTSVLCPDQNRGQPPGREDRLATSPSWARGSYDILHIHS